MVPRCRGVSLPRPIASRMRSLWVVLGPILALLGLLKVSLCEHPTVADPPLGQGYVNTNTSSFDETILARFLWCLALQGEQPSLLSYELSWNLSLAIGRSAGSVSVRRSVSG